MQASLFTSSITASNSLAVQRNLAASKQSATMSASAFKGPSSYTMMTSSFGKLQTPAAFNQGASLPGFFGQAPNALQSFSSSSAANKYS
jgi:hypothetical protein